MRILRFLLFPFAVLYDGVTRIRNYLYDIDHKKSFEFSVPVISVGNLNTGGSGKTPMIEYLIRLLKNSQQIATLSRGYGRKTKGLRFAGEQDSALTIGDEPYQLYKNFGSEVKVTVGEDRAFAIPNILNEYPNTSVILLDDAFQHRSVKPHYSILVTEYSKPFFKDFILPMGNLREARQGACRANTVVVTKCPNDLTRNQMHTIEADIKKYSSASTFFATIKYGELTHFAGSEQANAQQGVLLSGIANGDTFENQCALQHTVIKHFRFADHHRYTLAELMEIKKFILSQGKSIVLITTEKDKARLETLEFRTALADIPCYYLPIEMVFIENGSEFDKQILDATKLPEEA